MRTTDAVRKHEGGLRGRGYARVEVVEHGRENEVDPTTSGPSTLAMSESTLPPDREPSSRPASTTLCAHTSSTAR
jgi:hypothetical protein